MQNHGSLNPIAFAMGAQKYPMGYDSYRVYFTRCAEVVYLLLLGGDKSTQKRDIQRAIEMARALHKE